MKQPHDPLLDQLRSLPPLVPDPAGAARTRARARAAFLRSGGVRARPPWLAALGRTYVRVEPAMATCVVLAYLTWALQTAAGLLR